MSEGVKPKCPHCGETQLMQYGTIRCEIGIERVREDYSLTLFLMGACEGERFNPDDDLEPAKCFACGKDVEWDDIYSQRPRPVEEATP